MELAFDVLLVLGNLWAVFAGEPWLLADWRALTKSVGAVNHHGQELTRGRHGGVQAVISLAQACDPGLGVVLHTCSGSRTPSDSMLLERSAVS